MKTIIKTVHYFDNCKKSYLIKYFMAIHEKHCTKNPGRECRLCGRDSELSKELFSNAKECYALDQVKELADYCPNCILMILRNLAKEMSDDERYDSWLYKYEYKKELAEHWGNVNDERKASIGIY